MIRYGVAKLPWHYCMVIEYGVTKITSHYCMADFDGEIICQEGGKYEHFTRGRENILVITPPPSMGVTVLGGILAIHVALPQLASYQ